MGILSFLRPKPGLPLLRKIAGALLSAGQNVPAVTRPGPAGTTVLVTPEVIEPKGILRSRTVWASLLSAVFALAGVFKWNLGISEADATTTLNTLAAVFAGAAGWFRVKATMPTRG